MSDCFRGGGVMRDAGWARPGLCVWREEATNRGCRVSAFGQLTPMLVLSLATEEAQRGASV